MKAKILSDILEYANQDANIIQKLWGQSFISLKADLRQDINRGFAFSRCLNETFP